MLPADAPRQDVEWFKRLWVIRSTDRWRTAHAISR